MSFPWNNNNHEDGTIVATGKGESSVLVHFRVEDVEFEIVGCTVDPTPMSNHPTADTVTCSIQRRKRNLYVLRFQWNVFGTKEINWSADG